MTEIAKHAEVSTATAYRHFSSAEDVLHAFRVQVSFTLRDFSATRTTVACSASKQCPDTGCRSSNMAERWCRCARTTAT
ncbi:TetR family transcriptional regulator [Streptomyces sp. NPDC058683]|uniref:TetR family transcriptional regulator n=1 Tax=Streptomyces sp. NPDC058683 TaxID=3346597 RepID=UPI00365126A9